MGIQGAGKVLVVDDSADDRFLVAHAFEKAGISRDCLAMANDGEQAIAYLQEQSRPALLLLDLKMPKVDGFDVLGWIKSNPAMQSLPVIILTASLFDEDKQRAFDLGATVYIEKDVNLNRLISKFEDLKTQFFSI